VSVKASGTFFHISAKLVVILIFYLSFIYITAFVFRPSSNINNMEIDIVGVPKEHYNVTDNKTTEQKAQQQGLDLTMLALGGGGLLSLFFITRSYPDKMTILKVASLVVPVLTVGSYLTGYGLQMAGVDLGIDEFIAMLSTFGGYILDLISTIVAFLTFNVVGGGTPIIPFPFNVIPFIMTIPVLIVVIVWCAGLLLEVAKSIKVPFAG
jgi:hypothetical protein